MIAISRFRVEPSWPVYCCGSVFTVASFTNERYLPLTRSRKKISRMTRYIWLLWVMQAVGDTLSVGER